MHLRWINIDFSVESNFKKKGTVALQWQSPIKSKDKDSSWTADLYSIILEGSSALKWWKREKSRNLVEIKCIWWVVSVLEEVTVQISEKFGIFFTEKSWAKFDIFFAKKSGAKLGTFVAEKNGTQALKTWGTPSSQLVLSVINWMRTWNSFNQQTQMLSCHFLCLHLDFIHATSIFWINFAG